MTICKNVIYNYYISYIIVLYYYSLYSFMYLKTDGILTKFSLPSIIVSSGNHKIFQI